MITTREYQQLRRGYDAAVRDEIREHRSRGVEITPDVQSNILRENRALRDFSTSIVNNHVNPFEFSIRALWEHFVPNGREIVDSWNPRTRVNGGISLTEAGGAVNTGMFANVFGQITYTQALEVFNDPSFLHPQLATTVSTPYEFERIPGVSRLGDVTEEIDELQEYPTAGVGEEFVDTRPTKKHGTLVHASKEVMFFDRTGQVLNQLRDVTTALAIDKEKRGLDMATGQITAYRYNGRSAVATYGDDSGDHDWDNLAASNALADETDIENAMLLFDAITDPNTGEPVMIDLMNMGVLVPTALSRTLDRIINATEIREGDITSGAGRQTIGPRYSKLSGLVHLSNQYVKNRTSSATTWFIGNFMKAFAYYENWPIQTPPVPPNNFWEVSKDVAHTFKVTERGEYQCVQPRVVVKCTA